MKKLFYLIDKMTQEMDRNPFSDESTHLRILVYYAKCIVSESRDNAETLFNQEVAEAKSQGIWTPFSKWSDSKKCTSNEWLFDEASKIYIQGATL